MAQCGMATLKPRSLLGFIRFVVPYGALKIRFRLNHQKLSSTNLLGKTPFFLLCLGGAKLNGVQEVAGSNPAGPIFNEPQHA